MRSCAAKFRTIRFLSVAVLLLVTGCATTVLPNKTFVRLGPDYDTAMPDVGQLGLFVDAAVAYDETGSKFWDIEDSRSAIAHLTQETRSDLATKGYELAFAEAPFVGGFFDPAKPNPAAAGRDAEPHPMAPPFQVADNINADPDYRQALQIVDQRVHVAIVNRGKFPTESLQSDPATEAALKVIADKTHVRYLLVVQGSGNIVSTGKQVGQALGTAVLSTVLTLGMVTITSHNISLLDSYIALVDLQTAEVIWSNSLRLGNLNPAEANDYKSSDWAHKVLYWLPPRGMLEPPPVKK